MLALYRCGRQSEALEHYAAVRRRLHDELGLEPSRALRELQQRILRQDPALDAPPGGSDRGPVLPEPVNRLVGREGELDELRRILLRSDVRLLVLTGAGGSGKTRLALEAARGVGSSFANGTVVVELAPLDDPALVVPTITQALGIVAEPAGDALTTLAEGLRARELLLVVDNAEHLRAATPVFVELLSRAPRLTMLVTSRTVLHLSGEHVFPVQPLGTDAALELFQQRAASVQPRFELTDENEDAVREICARVDGLPLAIELAAARVRTLPARALAERLTERLSVLGGGAHDLPARQQTLTATLDWSYDLLTEDEQRFLARFSVFPAGATLEAAAAVCLAGDEDEALALVDALHDASLLTVQELGGGMRYRLLETVRQYAADRLRELGDEDTVRRHAEWCLALAEAAAPELTGDRQGRWFATLEAEHDNLRAALAYLDATQQRELQLRLAVALSRFWYVRGHLVDARRRLDEALADAADQPPSLRRRALTAASATALLQGDYAAATGFAESALDRGTRERRAELRRQLPEQPRRDRPRRWRHRKGGCRARGGSGARPRRGGHADRGTRDQQPRRPRAHHGRLRARPPAVRGEPCPARGAGRYREPGQVPLQPGRGRPHAGRRSDGTHPLSRRACARERDGGQGGHRVVPRRARRARRPLGGRRARRDAARCRGRAPDTDGCRLQAVRAAAARDDGTAGGDVVRAY